MWLVSSFMQEWLPCPEWSINTWQADKCLYSQSYYFSSGHVWMWELDCEESWVPKNWCFWSVVLEKTLESPLDCKEIQPVHPKGNQPWIFTGRIDTEAETPILWPPDAKTGFIGKDPDAGKDWGQDEKGVIEDEMAEWHHLLNGYEFEQTQGDSEGQGSLECYSPLGHNNSLLFTDWTTTNWLGWIPIPCKFQIHASKSRKDPLSNIQSLFR